MVLQCIDSRMPEQVANLPSSQAASVHGFSVAHLHDDQHESLLTGDFVASRFRCSHAKRVLIKVGTRVATRARDERLAIGRLGALAEAIQQLLIEKKQVILVICGANTVGRQKLRYQQVLHSSPLEYQRLTQEALNVGSCSAAGQSGVMALWDKLFTMLGVGSAQLLVSQEDLADEQTSNNLQLCVNAILEMGAVPILNENPASSPSAEVDNIFIDNDGLAASVAEQLSVDLSLFLTNVEGLPWDSTAFGQKEQKDPNSHANGNANNSASHSASAAWLHSSVQSGSAGSGDAHSMQQHPSIISTYCPQVHGQAEDISHSKGDSEEPDQHNAWGPEHTSSDSCTQSLRSKVAAAWRCAEAGGTAVVLNGLEPENIQRVCQGEKIGTMFNKQSALEVCMRGMHTMPGAVQLSAAGMSSAALDMMIEKGEDTPWSPGSPSSSQKVQKIQSMRDLAGDAAAASAALLQQPAAERSKILQAVAAAMEARKDEIMMANHMDIASFRAQNVSVPEVAVQRMKLDERRIDTLIQGIQQVANTEDPIGKTLGRTEIAQDLLLEKVTVPLGVVLCIFEARPDVVPQLIALAIRSGNGLLLKGSEEVQNSILLLLSILCAALAPYGCSSLVGLITSREDVDDLLEMDGAVDLVVVRGSNTLVRSIRDRTNMPVLGHSEGICCIYIDAEVDLEMACAVCVDSKIDYPAACNSVERICLHSKHREGGGLFRLLAAFRKVGVEVYGGSADVQALLNVAAPPEPAGEFHDLKVIVDLVADLDAAVSYIHTHGSAHTDGICTSSEDTANEFLKRVDSASVLVNCSTRFSDGQRFGLGAEVGISTGRVHARGPVGADGLTSTKYLLRGRGHVVNGDQGVAYTHREL